MDLSNGVGVGKTVPERPALVGESNGVEVARGLGVRVGVPGWVGVQLGTSVGRGVDVSGGITLGVTLGVEVALDVQPARIRLSTRHTYIVRFIILS